MLGRSWDLAVEDGFSPVPVEEAVEKGSVIMYLLSDAGQKAMWPTIKPLLAPGKTLFFSHGFSVVFKEDTGTLHEPLNSKIHKTIKSICSPVSM